MYFEDLADALGGANLTQSNEIYSGWSPNMYKTILIFNHGVYIEYHGGKSEFKTFKKRKIESKKKPLSVFGLKQFGCLEVLGIPESLVDDKIISTYFPPQTRLYCIFVYPDDFQLAPHFLDRGNASGFYTHTEPGVFLLETVSALEVRPLEHASAQHPLVPRVYELDRVGGKLHSLLVPEKMGDVSFPDEDTPLPDEETSDEIDPVYLKLLKACLEHPTRKKALCKVFASFTSPAARTEPWFKSLPSNYINVGREKGWTGVFLNDSADEAENAYTFIKYLPSDLRDLWSPKEAKSETIEGIIEKLSQPVEDFSEGLSFYSGLIKGTTLQILEEYDKIFASGFGVLKPVGVLTETSEGFGQMLSLSTDGRAYKKKFNATLLSLWRNKGVTWNCYENRNISEIAQIAIDDPQAYFPYKMLEYAFGRCVNDGERDLYPPHSSAKSWKDYRSSQVEKSLSRLLEKVVQKVLEKSSKKYMEDGVKTQVSSALQNIQVALCRCVLVSSLDVLNDMPVKIKVRLLTGGDEAASVVSPDFLRASLQESVGSLGGRGSQTYAPVFDGKFAEFRHDLDSTLANVEPLFAYKLLQASMDSGIPLNPNDIIMGISSGDNLVYSSDLKYNLHTSHFVLAGSRSGKGLLTQAIEAANMAVGVPSGLSDNKPDMSSLLLHLCPTSFVVNGANLNSAPDKGDDIFSQFTPEYIRSLEARAHIPEYLQNLTGFSSNYTGSLGTVVYLRYVLLALGILAVRSMGGDYPEMLGGRQGLTFIFDEISNTGAQLNNLIYGMVLKTHLLPARYMDAYDRWVEAGKGDKSRPKINANPEDFWYTAVYESLRASLQRLFILKNAGFKNQEALMSNVIMIGQDPEYPIQDAGEIDLLLPPPNAEAKGTATRPQTTSLLASLGAIGRTDAFLGYNVDHPEILNQDPNVGGKAKDKLNDKARNFAYVSDFTGETLRKAFSGDEAIAERATYFKPALLFADGSPEGYCWQNSVRFMQDAGLVDIEGVIARNSDADGNLHPAVGFEGYLNLAGVGIDSVRATQNRLAEAAQTVVDKLGYPGSWLDFLLDLRPEWIFSVDDIYKSFSEPNYCSRLTDNFRKVYPECFVDEGVGIDLGGLDDDDLLEETSPEIGVGEDALFEEDSSEIEVEDGRDLDDWFSDVEPSPAVEQGFVPPPQIPEGYPEMMPDIDVNELFSGIEHRELQVTEMTPEGFQQALLTDLERYVGDWHRVKSLSVMGDHVVLNKAVYRTKVSETWGESIPVYMREAVRTSNIAPLIPWTILRQMEELRVIHIDSWEFFLTYIAPDLGYAQSKFAVGELFHSLPKLQAVRIGDDMWDAHTYKKHVGTPSGFERYDTMNHLTRIGADYLSRGRSSSWEYTKSVWNRDDLGGLGKFWRTGMGLAGVAASSVSEGSLRAVGGVFNQIGNALRSFSDELRN